MLDDPGLLADAPDNLSVLQSISDAAPLRLRWSASLANDDVPKTTTSPAAGLSLSVRADGIAHLRGQAVPEAVLRSVHQEAIILYQLLNGRVVLHGSAVVIDGVAVATIGPSGAGKSTTAAALVRQGAALLADDVVAIADREGQLTVSATEAHVRLRDADQAGKSRIAAPALAPHAPLFGVLVLTVDRLATRPQWSRLHGLAALDAVREFGAGPKGLEVLGAGGLLKGLARVADEVQVWRLQRSATQPTPESIARELARLARERA